MSDNKRIERDSMGEMEVDADAYYGASTQRAVLNFPISTLRFSKEFNSNLALIKKVAAETNIELGLLDEKLGKAIISSADEVIEGKFEDHFVVDIFQTGSGTSTNMNANEVIANRSAEILGAERGSRGLVHPNDHVNMGQSSNDVIPTAIHITAAAVISHSLIPALEKLSAVLKEKSIEFYDIIKTGRTHLQDATPIRLGQEFDGYAGQADRSIKRLQHALSELCEVAIGGTAVGTGVNTHPEFASLISQKLSKYLNLEIRETSNHFQSQSTLDNMVEASGVTKTIAVSLLKIANDIRWLGSGPRAGFAEIALPEVQPGSSIMPGKVNPVIPESVCQVAAQVIGNDASVTIAGQSGNFEINVMMPVAAYNLIQSVTLLASVIDNFVEQCLRGIKSTSAGPDMVEKGLAICTGLVPRIGYDASAKIAKEAEKTGKTVREVAKEQTDLTDEELQELLDPFKMTEPGITGAPSGG